MIREKIARWICPELAEKADKHDKVLVTLTDCHFLFKGDVPEASQVCEWIIGKEYPGYGTMYKAAHNYPSLSKFYDIIVNEYRRKIK